LQQSACSRVLTAWLLPAPQLKQSSEQGRTQNKQTERIGEQAAEESRQRRRQRQGNAQQHKINLEIFQGIVIIDGPPLKSVNVLDRYSSLILHK
jgi:hypothetical protein